MELIVFKFSFFEIVAFTFILGIGYGTCQNVNSMLYKQINVNSNVLQNALTKEKVITFSRIACMQQGLQRSWSHLACFDKLKNHCTLYDVTLPSYAPVVDDDLPDSLKCYSNVHTGCWYGNQVHQEGDTRSGYCGDVYTCKNMEWISGKGALPVCPEGFQPVINVGCILLVELFLNFDDSKQHCEDIGARLIISDDYESFESLREWAQCDAPLLSDIRVGIVNGAWMDGSPINASYWIPFKPTNPQIFDCAYLVVAYQFLLIDWYCIDIRYFICELV